ncbi:aryl-sulfate sulfotransferase [Levilactobacillus bambusae]|uniref:Aryl-sulfate sulfotransferase n=1 Tax=Levilactobacillus bambusae TaxID=2024736 RepID=A0A2V1MXZ5_9LACO|nr:aryl-sulfate sulfotransferase [Levilactobacillus bambusae]
MSTTRQDSQKALVATYQKAATSNKYWLSSPYVKVNPYKRSPLTGLVIFQTSEASKVKVTVPGKTAKTTISTTYKSYTTKHSIPVMGLYAGKTNRVKLTVTSKSGKVTTKTVNMKTAALPSNLAKIKFNVKTAKTSKMALGPGNDKLTFLVRTTHQPFGVDAKGDIRWYSTDYNQHVFKQLKNNHILRLAKKNNGAKVYNEILEEDYLGRVYKQYDLSTETHSANAGNKKYPVKSDEYTLIHHDAVQLPNGNYLLTVSDGTENMTSRKNSKKRYSEDTIVELDHKTGKITRVIDFKKILPASMYNNTKLTGNSRDWLHMNSIYYDQKTGDIVVSSRNQDMVMRLNYKTLKWRWIYSSKTKSSWPKAYRKYLLTADKGTPYTGGQHAAILLPNSTSTNQYLQVFDNNIAVTYGDKKTSGKYSQGITYRINPKTKKVKKVQSYGASLGTGNFSPIIGSNRYLYNGNSLLDFGYLSLGTKSNIREVTKNGDLVYNLEMSNLENKGYTYRAERFSLYPDNDGSLAKTYE